MSYLPQEGPTSRAQASPGRNNDCCRARMTSSLNSSVMDRHTFSSARWRRTHTSPAVRATRSSFVLLWEKSDRNIREEIHSSDDESLSLFENHQLKLPENASYYFSDDKMSICYQFQSAWNWSCYIKVFTFILDAYILSFFCETRWEITVPI